MYKRAAAHYATAADLDPGDISCLIKRAKANFSMNKCKECVVDCDEALRRRRAMRSEEKLAADVLFLKALALLNLAVCAADHEPMIMALEGSLKLRPGSKETQAKLDMAKRNRDAFAEQQRLDRKAA